MRAGAKSSFASDIEIVELHIMNLKAFSSRSNYTMTSCYISVMISIL